MKGFLDRDMCSETSPHTEIGVGCENLWSFKKYYIIVQCTSRAD